jgi:hypothetical protein
VWDKHGLKYKPQSYYFLSLVIFCNEVSKFLKGVPEPPLDEICGLFRPVPTMNGLCYSYNAQPVDLGPILQNSMAAENFLDKEIKFHTKITYYTLFNSNGHNS